MVVSLKDFDRPSYYLDKLRREIDRLREAQKYMQSEDVKDHGINAAITAWHLPEWAMRSINPDEDVNFYRNNLVQRNRDYGLMHDLATQAKHFKVSAPMTQNFEVRTSARATYTEEEKRRLEEHVKNNPSEALYMRLTNSFQSVLKIEDRDALPLLEEIYEFLSAELMIDSEKAVGAG
jgi:hypothetical protein